MHVHSTASELSKLGVQRSLHLPECATEPLEVYELAKARGMDFVTITDHDTIAGALQIAHLPDAFVSEELTAHFLGEPQAVHVLCYGINPADHEWLQANRHDVETCAEYLSDRQITCALAHPFYAVGAPLTAQHRRRLAQLFPIWETRNGSRAKELNRPAFLYIETHGGTAIGGSDDHAGIDIGRTYTETPVAAGPQEFLANIQAGQATAHGDQGGAAKWAHAAIALAIRTLGEPTSAGRPDPQAILRIVERVLAQGELRSGAESGDLGPGDARALLQAWLAAMELDTGEHRLLPQLQHGEVSHDDLFRRARCVHERQLAQAVDHTLSAVQGGDLSKLGQAAGHLFDACIPAIPYAAAAAFLGREKFKLARSDGDQPRVAVVADGLGATHGVSRTIAQLRERGVPGYEVEVIGTDGDVDRRLSTVAEVEVPFYAGTRIGVPGLPAMVEAISEGRYDLIHVCTPGPVGAAAWLLGRLLELPLIGSYHTELGAYAGARSGHPQAELLTDFAMARFYGACETVLSPSSASDERLERLGIDPHRIARWDRGVDLSRFSPELRDPQALPGQINLLYAGRLAREKGIDRLAEAFELAHRQDPRLHLVLAGGGPEEPVLRERLGAGATFLGWLTGNDLARAYASADVFMFASRTDTFGQVILEAQASGLPVVAVGEGGPKSLIESGESGLLTEPRPEALAEAVLSVVRQSGLAERLRRGGLAAVAERTWGSALQRLADGYDTALERRNRELVELAA